MLTKLTEQEKQFGEWLKEYHLGKLNAVNSRNLRQFGTKREIRYMTHSLRLAGYPICSGQQGYYYAESSEELVNTLNFLKGLYEETRNVYYGLSDTYYEMKFDELEGGRDVGKC